MITQVIRSLKDHTFAVKVLNKISGVTYVPEVDPLADVNRCLTNNYPGDGWQSLSRWARELWVEFFGLFKEYDIKTIAYIGAHDGSMALTLDEAFPGRTFCLVEPVPTTFARLKKNIEGRANFRAVNAACGPETSRCEMFVDEYSQASSLLKYEEKTIQELGYLGLGNKVAPVEVEVKRLDDLLREVGIDKVDLLIMDVQGYEDQVILGGEQTLAQLKAVVSEMSVESLYVNSSSFDSVYQAMLARGLKLRFLVNPVFGEQTRQNIQIDGIFVRPESAKPAPAAS